MVNLLWSHICGSPSEHTKTIFNPSLYKNHYLFLDCLLFKDNPFNNILLTDWDTIQNEQLLTAGRNASTLQHIWMTTTC